MMTVSYKLLENETVLVDDYPIYYNYVYIVDGILTKSKANGTVKEWKDACEVKEIRRCDLFGHEGAEIGDVVS